MASLLFTNHLSLLAAPSPIAVDAHYSTQWAEPPCLPLFPLFIFCNNTLQIGKCFVCSGVVSLSMCDECEKLGLL